MELVVVVMVVLGVTCVLVGSRYRPLVDECSRVICQERPANVRASLEHVMRRRRLHGLLDEQFLAFVRAIIWVE